MTGCCLVHSNAWNPIRCLMVLRIPSFIWAAQMPKAGLEAPLMRLPITSGLPGAGLPPIRSSDQNWASIFFKSILLRGSKVFSNLLRSTFLPNITWMVMALFILPMSPTAPAWSADKKETRQREAQRRTQQAIKQAQAKTAELEQANTELGNKLKEQEQRVNETQQNLAGFSRKNKRLAEDYAKEQGKAVDLEAKLKEAESNLRHTQTELAEVSASYLETQRHLKTVASEKT